MRTSKQLRLFLCVPLHLDRNILPINLSQFNLINIEYPELLAAMRPNILATFFKMQVLFSSALDLQISCNVTVYA